MQRGMQPPCCMACYMAWHPAWRAAWHAAHVLQVCSCVLCSCSYVLHGMLYVAWHAAWVLHTVAVCCFSNAAWRAAWCCMACCTYAAGMLLCVHTGGCMAVSLMAVLYTVSHVFAINPDCTHVASMLYLCCTYDHKSFRGGGVRHTCVQQPNADIGQDN